MNAYLKANFATVHTYHIASREPAQFKYKKLLGQVEGVAIIDDLKSQDFTDTQAFFNLLDEHPFVAAKKYEPSDLVQLKGAAAITTTKFVGEGVLESGRPDRLRK